MTLMASKKKKKKKKKLSSEEGKYTSTLVLTYLPFDTDKAVAVPKACKWSDEEEEEENRNSTR